MSLKVIFLGILLIAQFTFTQNSSVDAQADDVPEPFFYLGHWGGRQRISDYIGRILGHIGIGVNTSFSGYDGPVFDLLSQTKPEPLYEDGGFDISTLINVMDNTLAPFPVDMSDHSIFDSENIFEEIWVRQYANLDVFSYNNPEYYNLLSEIYNSSDQTEALKNFMEFFEEEMPTIPLELGSDSIFYSNSTGLTIQDAEGMFYSLYESSLYSEGWRDLDNPSHSIKIGYSQPYKRTFPLQGYIQSQRGLVNFASLVFESLYQRDYNNNFEWIPLLADGFPTVSPNKLNVTIHLKSNITFADGMPLTAYDVVNSYQTAVNWWYKDSIGGMQLFFDSVNDFKILDNYTIQIDFNYPTPHYMEGLKLPIFPFHTYGNYTLRPPYDDIQLQLFDDLYINGSSPFGFGTGPFIYGQSTEFWAGNLTYVPNPNYRGTVRASEIQFVDYGYDDTQAIMDLVQGNLDIIFPDLTYNKTLAIENNLNFITKPIALESAILINHLHPIIGTGVDTPLGKDDPNRAFEAAKYVRKAMSYAINRYDPDLEFEYPTSKPYFQLYGNFEYITNHEFSFSIARSYMELAGYEYTDNTEQPLGNTSQTSQISVSRLDNVPVLFWIFPNSLIMLCILIGKARRSKF